LWKIGFEVVAEKFAIDALQSSELLQTHMARSVIKT